MARKRLAGKVVRKGESSGTSENKTSDVLAGVNVRAARGDDSSEEENTATTAPARAAEDEQPLKTSSAGDAEGEAIERKGDGADAEQ